jgi:hypothetical protein
MTLFHEIKILYLPSIDDIEDMFGLSLFLNEVRHSRDPGNLCDT